MARNTPFVSSPPNRLRQLWLSRISLLESGFLPDWNVTLCSVIFSLDSIDSTIVCRSLLHKRAGAFSPGSCILSTPLHPFATVRAGVLWFSQTPCWQPVESCFLFWRSFLLKTVVGMPTFTNRAIWKFLICQTFFSYLRLDRPPISLSMFDNLKFTFPPSALTQLFRRKYQSNHDSTMLPSHIAVIWGQSTLLKRQLHLDLFSSDRLYFIYFSFYLEL